METNRAKLSADEEKAWKRLVEIGMGEYEKDRSNSLVALGLEDRKMLGGATGSLRRKPGKRTGEKCNRLVGAPVSGIRYVLARSAGLSHKKAVAYSDAVWSELSEWKNGCEEFRYGWKAMEVASNELIATLARSTIEEAVCGEDVNKIGLRAAMWGLERLDRSTFADPSWSGSSQSVQSGVGGNGGILIQVVGDAAKIAEKRTESRKAVVYTDV